MRQPAICAFAAMPLKAPLLAHLQEYPLTVNGSNAVTALVAALPTVRVVRMTLRRQSLLTPFRFSPGAVTQSKWLAGSSVKGIVDILREDCPSDSLGLHCA